MESSQHQGSFQRMAKRYFFTKPISTTYKRGLTLMVLKWKYPTSKTYAARQELFLQVLNFLSVRFLCNYNSSLLIPISFYTYKWQKGLFLWFELIYPIHFAYDHNFHQYLDAPNQILLLWFPHNSEYWYEDNQYVYTAMQQIMISYWIIDVLFLKFLTLVNSN